ncbi:TPA: hypothetical protein QCY10_000130 [Bacillus mobilis]|nr:hypothetical protein [Bacillus mobilis]
MKGKMKKLRDATGKYLYPVTRAEAVFTSDDETLATTLTNLKNSINNGTGGGGSTGPVSPNNIDYIELVSEKTRNVFDKRTVERNGYYDQPNGKWISDAGYVSSALISVTPGKTYTSKFTVITTFWNSNKTYVEYTRSKSFVIPANVSFIRLTLTVGNIDAEMFVQGSTLPSAYEPYGETPVYKLPNKTFIIEPPYKGIEEKHLSDDAKKLIDTKIIEDDRLERARGKVNLFIETSYEGYNQPIHPKVLAFSTPWNGYKYWMASTPYPYAIDDTENPHIHASNDLIHWEVPAGVKNPIDDLTDGTQSYWSDTHLVYRPDLNRLECWYRGVVNAGPVVSIVRKVSTDGVNWSNREIMETRQNTGGFLSHAIIWDSVIKKYRIWVFGGGQGYYETPDGKAWSKIADLRYDISGVDMPIWHADVEKTDIGYEMVVQPTTNDCQTIDHYISDDGITWREKKALMRKNDIFGIDAGGFYRPCMFKKDGIYYVFVSTISKDGVRGITLSIAAKPNNILSLQGIDADHLQYMNVPTRKPRGGRKGQIVFDQSLGKAIICITGGRNAIWKDFNGNQIN